jgi:predicted N-acyltransferase
MRRELPVIFPAIVEEGAVLGKMDGMQARRYTSYTRIPAGRWNALAGADNPFLRHEFLLALETSGSATAATGWTPAPIVVEDAHGAALGALPLWIKDHSFGELVYDFAWAQAYQRAGLRYYPKLIAAVPFSPAAGPRLLIAPGTDRAAIVRALDRAARALADDVQASSLHWLFTNPADTRDLETRGYLHRTGVQFHWQNHGYRNFDDFLAGFSATKRKKLKRERRYVAEAGVVVEAVPGPAVTPALWDVFYDLYTAHLLRLGGMLHLTREFFPLLGAALPEAVVLVVARRAGDIVGAAFNLRGGDALYGRYWGGRPEFHSLHFETCYYTPIEYCITEGLQRFEGGAGGEHKLARGFLPVATHSMHWLRQPQFANAVADFLEREQHGVAHYLNELEAHAPFKGNVLEQWRVK